MSRFSNQIIDYFSPGDTLVRYKMWVSLSLIIQVVFCLIPSILLNSDTVLELTFLYSSFGVAVLSLFIRAPKVQRVLAFLIALYGLSLCFTLTLLDLTNSGILLYLLGWSMVITVGYSKEYFNVKHFIIFMFFVLTLFALSLFYPSYTQFTFIERLSSILSGTLVILMNIYLQYMELGPGKNHYSEKRRRYEETASVAEKMSQILSSEEDINVLLSRVSKECLPLLIIDNCNIYIKDRANEKLIEGFTYSVSAGASANNNLVELTPEGAVCSCFKKAELIFVAEVGLTNYTPSVNGIKKINSELAVPIFINGKVEGVIHSCHSTKDFFRDRHIQAFSVIAAFCGIKLTQHYAKASISAAEKARLEVDRYKELDELKNRFITNISHDLKTPLSLIKAPAKQIAKQSNDPKIVNLSNYITNNADHLLRVVHQLLQLNRVDQGVNELYLEEVDVSSLSAKISGQYEERSNSKKILLNVEVEPMVIRTDTFRLEQVIHNLLSNAFRYVSTGGKIDLIGVRNHDSVTITVKDNGSGIPSELQEKVFERFFKIDVNNHGGTGIGLSLVQEYVQALEGEVALTSTPGVGTTFTISLPLSHSLYDGSDHDPMDVWKEEDQMNASKSIMLVVEDHVDLNNFICSYFEEKYHCISAFDGEEALFKMNSNIPDIIVTDLMMPKKDGNTLVSEIRMNDDLAHIPIIVLSAKSQVSSKIDLYEIGADNFLSKPFDIEELDVVVSSTLKKRQILRDSFRKNHLTESHVETLEVIDAHEEQKTSFLDEAKAIIMENLGNSEFKVQSLTSALGIGRNRLQKEIKEQTELTPVEFIRSVRLNEARKKLKDKSLNVSEVAYYVGFSNLSYFTRSYKLEFGVLPSEE